MKKKSYYSDAVNKAVQKYNKANYDRFILRFKKGEKKKVFSFAKSRNKSVNKYINDLIKKDMESS